jgi:hypothetical protein
MLAIYEVFSAAGYDRSTLARLVRVEPAPVRILS